MKNSHIIILFIWSCLSIITMIIAGFNVPAKPIINGYSLIVIVSAIDAGLPLILINAGIQHELNKKNQGENYG